MRHFQNSFFSDYLSTNSPTSRKFCLILRKSFASLKLCPKIKNPEMGASVCKKLHIKRTAFKTWTRTLNPEKYHTEKVTHIDRANNWSFKIIHFIWKPQNLTLYGRHVQLKWVYLNVNTSHSFLDPYLFSICSHLFIYFCYIFWNTEELSCMAQKYKKNCLMIF